MRVIDYIASWSRTLASMKEREYEEDFGGEDKDWVCQVPVTTPEQEQSWMLFWFLVWVPIGIVFCCL